MTTDAYRVSITLEKEDFKFSAAHFTIFADGTRERLHGHNFHVCARIDADVAFNGMTFDYGHAKHALRNLCGELDEFLLLPGLSPYLRLVSSDATVSATIGSENLVFPASDVKVLPIENVTVEELSRLLTHLLVARLADVHGIFPAHVTCSVSSGPGQSASFALAL